MAFISLDQMYSAWKRVADWVSGTSTDKPICGKMNQMVNFKSFVF